MDSNATPSSSILEQRRAQMFPVFDPAQRAVARRFGGEPQTFGPGALVFELGEAGVPAWLVMRGSIEVCRRDRLGDLTHVTTHGPGEFTGEISQLAGGASLARGVAGPDGAEAVPFDAAQVRALVVACAEVGEAVMRAFILRRTFLIESGAGLVLLGQADSPHVLRLQNFLRRNAVPYTMLDPATDPDADQLIHRLAISKAELPIALCPDGSVLRDPDEKALARSLHLLPDCLTDRSYDAAIVGAGPAGLATAVYAASEGLSVLVLDSRAFGGQAGASSRIENYLGFPTGISGEALAGRSYAQAEKFGAVMAIPAEVTLLKPAPETEDPQSRRFELALDTGKPVRASAVVVASGARYRKLDLPNLDDFEGRGVYYWASPIESRLCARRDVVVVGGGNSAGQGVVFLSAYVSRVYLLVRGRHLGEKMSQYLVERIQALPNVEVRTETEITGLIGERTQGLQAVRWRNQRTGDEETHDIHHVFLFIGADANTGWLRRCGVRLDEKGFVHTGAPAGDSAAEGTESRRFPLETSQHGVFAIGDVRAGSVKRVAAAVGEGASLVAQLHDYLRADSTDPS